MGMRNMMEEKMTLLRAGLLPMNGVDWIYINHASQEQKNIR